MLLKFRTAAGVTAGLLLVTFIFYVASNATYAWGTSTPISITATIGLWNWCLKVDQTTTCATIICPINGDTTNFCSKIQAAEAFMTLACLFSGAAAIGFIVCAVLVAKIPEKTMKILLITLKAISSFCVLCGFIGVVVGSTAVKSFTFEYNYSLGAGAIVGIIGLIINVLAAIATFMVRPDPEPAPAA